MSRFTDPDKWHKDKWFRKLEPLQKLIFLYLIDNCDIAGFWEKDFDMMAYSIGVSEEEIEGAYEGLGKSLVEADGWLWVRHFIKHQKNLPLNPKNNAHKGIIRILKLQYKRFHNSELFTDFLQQHEVEIKGADKGLNSPTGKGKSKGNKEDKSKNFKEYEIPTEDDVEEYFEEDGSMIPSDVPLEAEKFWNHYDSVDWKTNKGRGKRIKNWHRQAGSWIANYKQWNKDKIEEYEKKQEQRPENKYANYLGG